MIHSPASTDPRDSTSPFGVLDFLSWDHEKFGFHYRGDDVERALALMREAGVGFIRFHFLWEDIEPRPDEFRFAKYDRLVDSARAHDICVQGVLGYTPLWHRETSNSSPDPMRYARYAQAVVEHFRDRVRHWQIWNEPDHGLFWNPQDHMQSYAALLQHVYPALKSTDPTCVIHLGGMSRSLPNGLKDLYARGAQPFFDVVDINPFVNPLTPDAAGGLRYLYDAVRRVLSEFNDETKPVWFTEIGCPGIRPPNNAPNWWLGKNPTETVQAGWVRTVYEEVLDWKGIEKIFWCFFRDTVGHFKSGSDYEGLVRHDFSKKPAFDAYRDAVSNYRNTHRPLSAAKHR